MPLSSYLTRLIWWCVLPLVAFAAWLAYDHVRTLQAGSDREARHIAKNFATAIDHHLAARADALNVIAISPLAGDAARWPDLYTVAQSYRESFGSHVVLAEATEPMRMFFNTRVPLGTPLPLLPRPSGKAAASQAIASGRPAVGDTFAGPVAKETLIAIAAPVRRQGETTHLLLATFETRLFQKRLEQVALPPGWGLALRDSRGDVIARRWPAGSAADQDAAAYRRVVIPLSEAPWSAVMEIPHEIYLAPTVAAGLALGLGVLVATLVGIGGGLWGKHHLGRAVASLAYSGEGHADGPEIAEIAMARDRINDASQRIASFAAAQDQAIEQERRRVAREVHDQMGQVFTAIRLIVQSLPREAFPDGQEAALQQALEMGIASARKITAELRPPLLDDLGLAAALEHYVREIARAGGLACTVALDDQELLCAPQALALFRIVQEAVTNILRHAGATRVDIAGQRDGDQYCLRIEDDGRGFDQADVRQDAMGLINMRERARLMHGQCEIVPRPAGGMAVVAYLPLDKLLSGNDHEHPAA